jgi:hypothetical protein
VTLSTSPAAPSTPWVGGCGRARIDVFCFEFVIACRQKRKSLSNGTRMNDVRWC